MLIIKLLLIGLAIVVSFFIILMILTFIFALSKRRKLP